MNKVLLFLVLILAITGCRKEYLDNDFVSRPAYTYSGKQVRDYFTLLCKISKSTPGFFPPQVARAYGYIGIANYEVVVNGIPGAPRLAGQINGLAFTDVPKADAIQEYDWSIASNAALADMMKRMFEKKITAANLRSIDSTEDANLKQLSANVNPEVTARSIQLGKSVSLSIYKYSLSDGAHESYIDPFQLPFSFAPDPSCWIPTGAVTTPVSPKWGSNRPFLAASANVDAFVPKTFSTNTTSSFYGEAMEVYNQVKNNTPEQVEIAKYWADDPFATCTPTGHTFNIMTQLLDETNATLEKSTVAYAKLCIAENDAFIACWKGKYKYSYMRPVTYIQQNIDPSFKTVIGTPAFPTFTSGHSAEIGAGSKIFIDMFTDGSGSYNFTDYSQLQYGFSARRYSNFNSMAEECANSRFYAGIHFPMDNELGLEMGRRIGDNVNRMIRWPNNIR